MEQTANQILLRGTLGDAPRFSHENHGQRYFRFTLEVPRLSGTVDVLPVVAPEGVLQAAELTTGSMLTITGQVRSHNIRSDGQRHLMIFVYPQQILCEDGPAQNEVSLDGILCRQPTFRRTPLGREICDCLLAVPRAFQRADYLPCILWGRTAQEISRCACKDRLHIQGRLQSRPYTKLTEDGPQQRIAYEISALSAQAIEGE